MLGETSGDGDGDGEQENLVVDMFSDACAVTSTWTTVTTEELEIACDVVGTEEAGWMVRHAETAIGDDTFTKVIAITTPPNSGEQVRGFYNLDDVPGVTDLEFRADLLLRCTDASPSCIGRFGLAFAEGNGSGLFAIFDDRDLSSGTAPLAVSVSLSGLATFSEPTVVLLGERTDQTAGSSPEVLIVNPRLVLP